MPLNRRAIASAVVLLAWAGGIVAFVRRETGRTPADRLAEAALRVSPGASYFAVLRSGAQIGFASTTVDTMPRGLQVTDYVVADVGPDGAATRTTSQTVIHLSRGLALRDFRAAFGGVGAPRSVRGWIGDDSVLAWTAGGDRAGSDTQRVRVNGPVLLPAILPLALTLGERPHAGRSYSLDSFDPARAARTRITVRVAAESVFTVVDSAGYDAESSRWIAAHADTVRAWHFTPMGAGTFDAWVDDQGHIVEATVAAGVTLQRTAYEIAFENWRAAMPPRSARPSRNPDILEATAIASRISAGGIHPLRLRVRLTGIPLAGFVLDGWSQRLEGDTLTIVPPAGLALMPSFTLPTEDGMRRRFADQLGAGPLLQTDSPEIRTLATRLRAHDRDPRLVAERILRWVHDSIAQQAGVSIPSALQVLRERTGDCNELTQLYVALARAAGIPARSAVGLVTVRGKFYYHAWPEIWLQTWTPVDPTFDEFPASAAHLRLLVDGVGAEAELMRVVGRLRLEIISAPGPT